MTNSAWGVYVEHGKREGNIERNKPICSVGVGVKGGDLNFL